MTGVQGQCDPHFERVADILAEQIASGAEVGASLYVSVEGEPVIDLWGGWHDRDHSAAWGEHSIVNVFSATKTVTSLAILMLADRGAIDLFAPVADYWPEFAQNGKESALVRHLFSHTVGLPAWDPPFSLAEAMDVETATARLAAQAPWWPPGTRGSYHASSFGHLAGELVRRVTGAPLSRFIADEIAGPLDADFFLGLRDEQFADVATVYPAPGDDGAPKTGAAPAQSADDPLATERAISARTRLGSFSGQKRDPLALFNSPEWRRTEFGGSTGHTNARGLGRIMTAISNGGVSRGVRLLSPATIDLIFQEQFRGVDSYYLKPIRWGTGYALAPQESKERGPLPFLRPSPRTCYWYGTGGSLSIADVERGVTLTYAMNQCQSGRHSLNGVYYDAIYDCL
ncbi:serine hydrolase [Sphingobium sp.]|uniref:serine hydrolase domain-containing protein n=1 Tax=Sphingobium sp. TaxID=1912891 RepID=UPI00262DBCC1|nr:serine hydrolase domain-containing protein [Sphingobium sp.]